MADSFDEQDFYELMQQYRTTPPEKQAQAIKAFENVKSFVRMQIIRARREIEAIIQRIRE